MRFLEDVFLFYIRILSLCGLSALQTCQFPGAFSYGLLLCLVIKICFDGKRNESVQFRNLKGLSIKGKETAGNGLR